MFVLIDKYGLKHQHNQRLVNNKLEVAIVDYGSGNLNSIVSTFFEVVARMGSINCDVFVLNKPDDVSDNNKIILPKRWKLFRLVQAIIMYSRYN